MTNWRQPVIVNEALRAELRVVILWRHDRQGLITTTPFLKEHPTSLYSKASRLTENSSIMATTWIACKRLFSVPRSLPGCPSASLLLQPQKGLYRSYYSEHHPDPAPFPPIQAAILSAALNRVP